MYGGWHPLARPDGNICSGTVFPGAQHHAPYTFMSAMNMILEIDGATHTPTPPVSSDADVAATAVVPPSPSVSTKHAMPSATPGHAGTRDS
jgi:hypothetical protein